MSDSALQTTDTRPTSSADRPSAAKILVVSGLGLLFDSMDVSLLSFVLVSLTKQWHLASSTVGLLGSISLVGMAVGSALAGLLSDRFGRRSTFLWTLLIYSIATGLSALAAGVGIFIVLRFIVGFGLGGELPVATTYVLESSPEQQRGRRVVLLEAFWAVGSLVAALISFFVIPSLGWRIAFLIGAIPALYTLVLRFSLPESPKYRALGKRRATVGMAFKTLWRRDLVRATCATWIVWFAMNFSYYGMFLWLPSVMALKGYSLVHSIGYTLIMTLAEVPGYLMAAWLVEKWGRKRTLLPAMLLAALSALGFGFAANTAQLILFGLLLSFFMLAAFGATYIFTVEQFPVFARGSGMGWAAGFGRIGGIIGPYLVGALIAASVGFSTIFAIFFVVTLVGFLLVWWLGRETKGKQIDEL
ncbi:MFS transporter [Alicyclobacillus cycloheptanicus]|uniref:MFS transporter n=1 Tax=Alicyclobacillus cycloheptanicus TaxID=1457 RepID=A0ABT9XEH2_9BACL|nr:MFS transporter [Alicyclobacillus cycloheptanicus]MDQ0188694.1 putative MFS transporter [Alicyclobacillus cycloheptanicus]WDM00634.1 MFS transporter [Alicyclobacillus cycloheptanicus]